MKIKILALSLTLLALLSTTAAFDLSPNRGKGAIIQLSGTIQASSSGSLYSSSGITPGQVRELNEKVRKGDYEAVVYEINSGGGTVVASKEVMRAIEGMEIPTICRFRDVAASGAYLFSLGCDRIVADSASLTGSVGVKSSYLEFSGTLDRYGVEYVNITSGKHKDLSSPYQNATAADKKMLQEKAEMIHRQFLDLVDEKRNLSQEQLEEVSTANIFLGTEAEKLDLVDKLGGRETAFDVAENMTDKKLSFSNVQQTQSFDVLSLLSMDSFVQNVLGMNEAPLKATIY